MGIEKYLDRLKEVEARFYEYRQMQTEIVDRARNQIVKPGFSRGPIDEPSPHFWQRMGIKPGKVIREPVESDWCYRNHYDADGRLVMVEEYSVFLGHFEITKVYLYGERTEMLYFTAAGLTVLRVFEPDLMLAFAGKNGYIAEESIREDGILREVRISRSVVEWQESHRLHYDGEKLVLIEGICDNGYREVLYTTKKPDFGAIRAQVDDALRAVIGEQGAFSCLGIEGFLDQQQPMLCLWITDESEPPELIADWERKVADVPISDWMFSDAQLKKCVKMVAEILVELVREGLLSDQRIWFHQNHVCITEDFPGARNVLKKAGLRVR